MRQKKLYNTMNTLVSENSGVKLTPEEERVIVHKGTEAPFSGAYWNLKEAGTYVCKRCQTPLYRSEDKFDSGCGWPSFDDEIPGAVIRTPDADGRRVEIVCANCKAHLGHVFQGEGLTDKNTRHCVNSVSMLFVPATACAETAYFAGGCFWGVEDAFSALPGVCDVVSGYMGGSVPNPTYEQVCTGTTGHAETVRVRFDAKMVSYGALARMFFEVHDPTQINRQGPDVGTQYRSAIFPVDEAQRTVAQKLIDELEEKGWKVVTTLEPLSTFYPAEDYHQDYTKRTGRGACHSRMPRFSMSPSDHQPFIPFK